MVNISFRQFWTEDRRESEYERVDSQKKPICLLKIRQVQIATRNELHHSFIYCHNSW